MKTPSSVELSLAEHYHSPSEKYNSLFQLSKENRKEDVLTYFKVSVEEVSLFINTDKTQFPSISSFLSM